MDILNLQPSLSKVGGYLDWFDERAFDGMYGDWNHKERALRQVETGHDGVLKALLIAKCPRLRDLKFIPRAADKSSGSALWWLKTLISISKGIGRKLPRPWGDDSDTEESYESNDKEEEEEVGEDDTEVVEVEVENAMEEHTTFWTSVQDHDLSETEDEFNRDWESAYANWKDQNTLEEGLERMDIDEDERICRSDHNRENCPMTNTATLECALKALECPGFVSLQSVSIGVVSDTWMDESRYPCSLQLLGRLLRLPNLDTMYFNGLRCDGSEHFDENSDNSSRHDSMISVLDYDGIEAKSSSVKHLILEGLDNELDGEIREMIIKAPRALLTAAFGHCGPRRSQVDTAALVRDLAANQGLSLQSLVFSGYEGEATTNGKPALFRLYDFYDRFHVLKKVVFNAQDLATPWKKADSPYDCFPTSLEHLEIVDAGCGTWVDRCGQVMLLEQVIIEIIEGARYKNLKSIVLREAQYAKEREFNEVSFAKAVEAGKANNVAVCTKIDEPLENGLVLSQGTVGRL
ncbi:hypothetical protein N0V95_000309 [Ascochyta clinopodiicola]|nr:hypothetical protein N0V95_000309 [Ascochyta clinopodiicola]